MATVKVKFRTSRVPGKAGVIYYQLYHKQDCKQITTGFRIPRQCWDAERGELIVLPEYEGLLRNYQRRIEYDISLLQRLIREEDERKQDYLLSDIIALFRSSLAQTSVLAYTQEQIAVLRRNRQWGTARNYRRMLNSFSAFLQGNDIPFGLLDEELVLAYNDWLLDRKIVRNSISFYMRILRSVYNKAVRQHFAEQSFPFQRVYTGIDRTCKRAVNENIIVSLQQLDLSFSASLAFARDLFLFSYCTRGMAFVDVAYLRKENVERGLISYIRHKTGQRLTIRMEPCIEEIIARYQDPSGKRPYLFPILTSEDPEKAYRQYLTALGYQNQKLKRISELLGKNLSMSSYTARHTWATAARNRNVPLSIISAGMGHSSEKTTQIYLDSLENSLIDRVNQRILERLNHGISI